MAQRTFAAADLTTFTGLNLLGLTATGQHLTPQAATLECRLTEQDLRCTPAAVRWAPRGTISRRLTHIPYGHRPTTLLLRIHRYTCTGCSRFWQEDTSTVAPLRAKVTCTALDWTLRALVLDHLSVNRVGILEGLLEHRHPHRRAVQADPGHHPVRGCDGTRGG